MDGKVAFDLLSRAHRSCEMESPHESEAWQALKSAVEIANSNQQLKAEIAALVRLFPTPIPVAGCHTALVGLVAKMRQLSAV